MEVNTQERTIADLKATLDTRERTIADLKAVLSTQERTIADLRAELVARERRLIGLQADLAGAKALQEHLASQAAVWEASPNAPSPLLPNPQKVLHRLPERVRRFLLNARRKRAIVRSGLFDAEYYLAQNPEIAKSGMDPLRHYLTLGAAEGRDPSPFFDTSYYLERNRDVAEAGVNPLEHYVIRGAKEGRAPHPLSHTLSRGSQSPHQLTPSSSQRVSGNEFDSLCSPVLPPEGGVCIVTPDIVGPVKNGGIGTSCYHFARTLVEAGHSVSILFTGDLTDVQKAHWRKIYGEMQINFIALSDTLSEKRPVWGSSWFLERSWRVFQFLRRAKLSVIHFQDWQANGFWSIKAKQVGSDFSGTVLTVMTQSCTKWINQGMQQFSADPFETAKLIWAETYAIEHCDVLLSPSQYMFNWLAENQIRCPARTVRTPYVYMESEPTPLETERQVDNDHLIFFGRLETRKGLHVFTEALRRLKRDCDAVPRQVSFLGKHATVLGQPSAGYLKRLKQDFKKVEFRVINNFDHAEALRYIRQTNGLVVIPSLVDNYPLTVVECIQNRIPFLAAATGGIPEMIDERISFEPTPEALASRLATRDTIDHMGLQHKYSAELATNIWRDIHVELFQQASCSGGERGRASLEGRKVSVCIPFFNLQRYLETLVVAFSKQRYSNFEVIFVNDGSSDEASREFDRIAAETRDGRFRFLTTKNKGVGPARNFAAEQATGELLVFFDADNLPKSDHFIAILVRALQESGADCVTCPYDIVDADRGLPTEADVISTYRPLGPCLEAGLFENYLGDSTMIIDRKVLQKIGGWSANRASWDDWELLLNLCFRGFKLETVPDSLFYYRFRPDSMNRQHNLYLNYKSLFQQLRNAPAADLARITETVVGPMLLLQRNPEFAAKIVAH